VNKSKGFTLLEIIISIILVSILYLFAINNFSVNTGKEKDNINFHTLKSELLSYNYEKRITIKCIESDYSCFIFIDNKLQENKIKGLFNEEPTVYKYNSKLEEKTFNRLELEKLENHNIVFEYSCNKEKKCTEEIVFANNRGYIFNDINMKPIIVDNISEIEDYFQDKIQEVKDAF